MDPVVMVIMMIVGSIEPMFEVEVVEGGRFTGFFFCGSSCDRPTRLILSRRRVYAKLGGRI